jgi:aspartate-semialdehyde dehydrogenase
MALYPLHKTNPLKRVLISTYQSVSGAGKVALDQLRIQTKEMELTQSHFPAAFPFPIASNVIPQIGDFDTDGYSEEESKIIEETRKILHDQDIKISATCVRVPVPICHSEAVNLEFTNPMGVREAVGLLNDMPGLKVMDGSGLKPYPMPWDVQGTDDVYVGRLRRDFSVENGLALWVVSDNLRKGAALNAIQIAEEVLNRRVLKRTI